MTTGDITGDPNAKTFYTDKAYEKLCKHYGIELIGWPDGIDFKNMSDLKKSEIKRILDALVKDEIQWVRADSVGTGGKRKRPDGRTAISTGKKSKTPRTGIDTNTPGKEYLSHSKLTLLSSH